MKEQVEKIIENCLASGDIQKSSASALSSFFERYQKAAAIKKVSELDKMIFTRMYSRTPSSSELLKIRYWRCGHHLPANRQEFIRLGFALCLSLKEMNFLLTTVLREPKLYLLDTKEYMYASLFFSELQLTFEEAEKYALAFADLYPTSVLDQGKLLKERLLNIPALKMPEPEVPQLLKFDSCIQQDLPLDAAENIDFLIPYFEHAYELQEWALLSLCYRYLIRISDKRLCNLKIIPEKRFDQLRHILYTDLLDCLWHETNGAQNYYKKHIYSLNFSSELNRYFKRGSRISRDSLIRLFLIFTMPDTNIELINDLLDLFGFAPLSADITTASGVSQDLLLIQIFEMFESYRSGDYANDRELLQHLLVLCDQSVSKKLKDLSSVKKGNILYRKKQQLKDLRIMAPHSLRKEHL